MKTSKLMSLVLILMIITPILITTASGYNANIRPAEEGNTTITWNIIDAPEFTFSWWGPGFVFIGNWIADDASEMTYEITQIGNSDEYITGDLVLGNLSLTTNNTEVANNLILGVSGQTSWNPGLVIPISGDNVQTQNHTAYAAAERVQGNWGNGTIESWYETIAVGGIEYSCIVWNYTQDTPSYGEPQLTYLAYDLTTGVLVRCNSTFKFDFPYVFVLELDNILYPQNIVVLTLLIGVASLVVVLLIAIIIVRKRNQ